MKFNTALTKAIRLIARQGFLSALRSIRRRWQWEQAYRTWLREKNSHSLALWLELAKEAPPIRFSILMPVYNTLVEWLTEAVDSVRQQTWKYWELCIVDDGSSNPETIQALQEIASSDARIRVVTFSISQGISAATNGALDIATGDYIALLDHDDRLSPNALEVIAACLTRYPEAKIVYSDEDLITCKGKRFSPSFKPDWNPRLLLGQNYISHFCVYHVETIRIAGGFDPKWDGCQDWDLLLRCTHMLEANQIHHVPEVLYHWRTAPGSTALAITEKNEIAQRSAALISFHCESRGIMAKPVADIQGYVHLNPYLLKKYTISLIISCNSSITLSSIKQHLTRLRDSINPYACEIILTTTTHYDEKSSADFRVLYTPSLSVGQQLKTALGITTGEFVGMMAVVPLAFKHGWIDAMLAEASLENIGVVAPQLLCMNGRVFSSGNVFRINASDELEIFDLYAGSWAGEPGECGRARLARNCSVLRDMLFARRSVFEAVSNALSDPCWDVATTLATRRLGLWNIYVPLEIILPKSSPRYSDRFILSPSLRYQLLTLITDPMLNSNLDIVQGYPLSAVTRKPAASHKPNC